MALDVTQMFMARVRSSRSSNSTGSIASDSGIMAAPPMPWTARAAISTPAESASAHAAEAVPKSARPASSTRLRPRRSPRLPIGIISAPRTSVYAAPNHCNWLVEAIQLGGERREGDVEHRRVQPEREHGDGERGQRPPATINLGCLYVLGHSPVLHHDPHHVKLPAPRRAGTRC